MKETAADTQLHTRLGGNLGRWPRHAFAKGDDIAPSLPRRRDDPQGEGALSSAGSGRRSLQKSARQRLFILRGGGFPLMNRGSSLFRDRGEVSPCRAHAKPDRPITFRLGGFGEGGADLCVLDILFGL
jgi:hypothetical protein